MTKVSLYEFVHVNVYTGKVSRLSVIVDICYCYTKQGAGGKTSHRYSSTRLLLTYNGP